MNHQVPAQIRSNSFDSPVYCIYLPAYLFLCLNFTTISLEISIYMTYGQKMFETRLSLELPFDFLNKIKIKRFILFFN